MNEKIAIFEKHYLVKSSILILKICLCFQVEDLQIKMKEMEDDRKKEKEQFEKEKEGFVSPGELLFQLLVENIIKRKYLYRC